MTNQNWTHLDSERCYQTRQWGENYFGINDAGHLTVAPRRDSRVLDLKQITDQLLQQGARLPLLLRFDDILKDRVDALTGSFAQAMSEQNYEANYTAVYPIKVNQQRSVIETIVQHGQTRVGLEAGSRPELLAVLGIAPMGSTIICNGYKDRATIRLCLMGEKMGHHVWIVVEKPSEIPLILAESENLGVQPRIGLRARLASIAHGNWQNTGGAKSKFGLSAVQILAAIDLLKTHDKLACLGLVHFHLGSQIANLRDIQHGIREAARFYVELRRLGAPVTIMDVGGGLGVDYDGTRSRNNCSMNYQMLDYARAIVRTVQEICRANDMPLPDLISESGRALTAHHAILITNVIASESPTENLHAPILAENRNNQNFILDELAHLVENTQKGDVESYYEAAQALEESYKLYSGGQFSLMERARAEQLYIQLCQKMPALLDGNVRHQREILDNLDEKLAEKYFCNFSLFQSLPDAWALEQIFPVMPIQRLNEKPDHAVRLCDLTCDSDGQLDQYVHNEGVRSTLLAHRLREGEAYCLAFFMVGAYQEILGDMHNLFGDTDAANILLDANQPHGWVVSEREQGDQADELLRYVHIEPKNLAAQYRQKFAQAGLPINLLAELEAGLQGYTYLQ